MGDSAKLQSILHDTHVDTDDMRRRTDKLGLIATIRSGDLEMYSIKLSDLYASESGRDGGGYSPSLIR